MVAEQRNGNGVMEQLEGRREGEKTENDVVNVWTSPGGKLETDAILHVGLAKYAVNKDYLSTYSPVFHSLFNGDFLERRTGHYKAKIEEVDEKEFTELLGVILPTRNKINKDNVVSLFRLADRFQMETLKRDCISLMISLSTCDLPTITLLNLAFTYNSNELKTLCNGRIISQHSIALLKHCDSFDELPRDAKCHLLDLMFQLPQQTPRDRSALPIVYFEMVVGGRAVGRIVFELFSNLVPKTAENFRALCTGEKGMGTQGKPLHYKGSYFQVLKKKVCIGGGSFEYTNAAAPLIHESIYGDSFEAESFTGRETGPGVLAMLSLSANKNTSLFNIFAENDEEEDGKNVVIGRVVSGMEVVRKCVDIDFGTKVMIAACGQINPPEKQRVCSIS